MATKKKAAKKPRQTSKAKPKAKPKVSTKGLSGRAATGTPITTGGDTEDDGA